MARPVVVVGAARRVEMRVHVRVVGVRMDVRVQLAAPDDGREEPDAQRDQHDGDTQLEELRHERRDLGVQPDDADRDRQERRRVADAPHHAHQARAPEAPPLAHDGRDGGQMIDVERVPEAEGESETEDGEG
jgi:hypothetical protein